MKNAKRSFAVVAAVLVAFTLSTSSGVFAGEQKDKTTKTAGGGNDPGQSKGGVGVSGSGPKTRPPEDQKKGGVGITGKPHGGKLLACFSYKWDQHPEMIRPKDGICNRDPLTGRCFTGTDNRAIEWDDEPLLAYIMDFPGRKPGVSFDDPANMEAFRRARKEGTLGVAREHEGSANLHIDDIVLEEFFKVRPSVRPGVPRNPLFSGEGIEPWNGFAYLKCGSSDLRFPGLDHMGAHYSDDLMRLANRCDYTPFYATRDGDAPFELVFEALLDEFRTVPQFYQYVQQMWRSANPKIYRLDDPRYEQTLRELEPTDDAELETPPRGCVTLQAVHRSGNQIQIRRWYWSKLSPVQKAFLQLHELLYELGTSQFGQATAAPTRNLIQAMTKGSVSLDAAGNVAGVKPLRGKELAKAIAAKTDGEGFAMPGPYATLDELEAIRGDILRHYISAEQNFATLQTYCRHTEGYWHGDVKPGKKEKLSQELTAESSVAFQAKTALDEILSGNRDVMNGVRWSNDVSSRLDQTQPVNSALTAYATGLTSTDKTFDPTLTQSTDRNPEKNQKYPAKAADLDPFSKRGQELLGNFCLRVRSAGEKLILRETSLKQLDFLKL